MRMFHRVFLCRVYDNGKGRFGLKGAIKGTVTAGGLNMGLDILHFLEMLPNPVKTMQ